MDTFKLDSLPPEMVSSIFLNLPFTGILKLCQVSSYFSNFCNDQMLWASKAEYDFNFPISVFLQLYQTTYPKNPRTIYQRVFNIIKNPILSLEDAAENGDLNLVRLLLETSSSDLSKSSKNLSEKTDSLEDAPTKISKDLRESFLNRNAIEMLTMYKKRYLNNLMYYAGRGGHFNIINYLISEGANINKALAGAAYGGHLNLVDHLIDNLGATNIYGALQEAAYGGHLNIVIAILKREISDYNIPLMGGAQGGHLDIVEYAIQKGAPNLNEALRVAAGTDHLNVVDYLIYRGAWDLNGALSEAAAGGYQHIMEYLIEQGATDLNSALIKANENGHIDIVSYLLDRGAQF